MPFINIRVLKGTLSKEKKGEMIRRVSEAVSEIEASPSQMTASWHTHGALSKKLTLIIGELEVIR